MHRKFLNKELHTEERGQGLVEYALVLVLVAIVIGAVLGLPSLVKELFNIGHRPPFPVRIYFETPEDVIIQDIAVNSVKTFDSNVFDENTKIAIYGFESPKDSQGGVLVSDTFAAMLRQRGFTIVERDEIERILGEQQLIKDGRIILNDLDVANRLGNLEAVDYMIFGAVTLYKSEGQRIVLPARIRNEDEAIYVDEYNAYRDWYVSGFRPLSLDHWTLSPGEREEKLRAELNVLSLEELEFEFEELSKQEFRTIASIGVSAKLVDIKTGEIIWMGQAETTDFTLVSGANRIIEEFLNSMLD